MENKSTDVAKASIMMAISTRESEVALINDFKNKEILATAVDIGGDFSKSTAKIIERTLVAAKRSGLIYDCHLHDGAVAGAIKEALMQIAPKAYGLNVGGKIGIARSHEHISVSIFLSAGLLHLNEVIMGVAHRSIPELHI